MCGIQFTVSSSSHLDLLKGAHSCCDGCALHHRTTFVRALSGVVHQSFFRGPDERAQHFLPKTAGAAMGEAVSEHHSLFSAKTVLSVVHVRECGPALQILGHLCCDIR